MSKEILEIIQQIHKVFKERELTLSVAESCTGGLISHWITSLPGSSEFYRAGVIAYSEEAKKDVLGISGDILKQYGMVSAETALEMAEKERSAAKTDYSVSTTGNLGPDILEEKEKGLIFIAVSRRGKRAVKELKVKGNRIKNKEEASLAALRFLIEFVTDDDKNPR